MPVVAGKPLEPAVLYHYWHPDREGVEPCPKPFASELRAFHQDLAICRPPGQAPTISRPWLVWYRKPAVTHKLSPGWLLLFVWQTRQLQPLPLDSRIFANLYSISRMAFPSGAAYFDSVVKTMQADKAQALAKDKSNVDAQKREYMQHRKITNIGRGNKFALHHDGSIVPSRGEANWTRDTEMQRMPGELAKRVTDNRKRLASLRRDRGQGRS